MQGYSAGGQSELRVNTAELRSGGKGLEDAANSIPPPPEQFNSGGTDDLSKALIRLTQEKEAALIEGLPKVKKDSLKTAQDIGVAADRYETTDQEIADSITKRVAEFDALFHPEKAGGAGTPGSGGQFGQLVSGSGSGGGSSAASSGSSGSPTEGAPASSGGSAAGEAGSSSGQDPLQMLQQMGQPMMQMPMQMMQQAGQLPQGIMQAAQSGIQQISQMAGEAGKNGDAQKVDRAESEGKDQQEPEKKASTAPVPGAGGGGSTAERAPVAGPSSGGASENAPAGPKHEAAPVNPAPRKASTDSSILL